MSGYTKPAQAFSISDVIFFNWDLLVLDWDLWFYTRWVPGLTITIHDKITEYTCRLSSPTFPLKSNTTHPFCCTILLLNSLKIYNMQFPDNPKELLFITVSYKDISVFIQPATLYFSFYLKCTIKVVFHLLKWCLSLFKTLVECILKRFCWIWNFLLGF